MTTYSKRQRGFTIVELLIVIVVIGILAAITIVAFNGVQNRGKTASAQSLANSIDKKLEAWNATTGSYPPYCDFATNSIAATGTASGIGAAGCTASATAGPVEAKLDNVSSIIINTSSLSSTNATTAVRYEPCSTGATRGGTIHYYDSVTGAITTTTANANGNKSNGVGTC